MNILFSVSGYSNIGGVQIVTKYLCEHLVEKGHNVSIVTNFVEGHEKNEVCNGVHITRFKEKDLFKIHTGEKKLFQEYILKISKNLDCIITVCAQSFASEWIWEIQDKLYCKKILYMHGMRSESINLKKINSFKHLIKEFILIPWWNIYFKKNWKYICKYDSVIHLFENDTSYNYFQKYGYNNNYVIKNSCEDEFFLRDTNKEILSKYGIKNDYYICVANYDNNKNQILAYESFVEANLEDKELIFIGAKDNSYSEALKEKTKKYNNIKVLVGISRNDTIALIKKSYSILLSSKSEYCPLTIVEGMASGRPFICTNVGVVPMIPGGVITSNKNEMTYWIKYYSKNLDYVKTLGKIAKEYAIKNFKKIDKIAQLELIISSSNNC